MYTGKLCLILGVVVLYLLYTLTKLAPEGSWHGILPSSFRRCRPTGNVFSRVPGGVPGFLVFENIWFRNDTFYVHNPLSPPFPTQDEVFSGPVKLVESGWPLDLTPDQCFYGTSVFLNEGAASGWNGLWHYYHFAAENILGAFAALGSAHASASAPVHRKPPRPFPPHPPPPFRRGWGLAGRPNYEPLEEGEAGLDFGDQGEGVGVGEGEGEGDADAFPVRIFIPWEAGWRDKWGMNEMVVRALFGDRVTEKEAWDDMNKNHDQWLFFERVIIVDRWASHRHNPTADQWNKMAVPIFDVSPPPYPSFFSKARKRMLEYHGLLPPPRGPREKRGKGKVVYIDRQGDSRKLYDEDHEALVDMLDDLARERGVRVEHVKLEEIGKKEQIQVVADATVMIGIHGNGLTHEMWMPKEATLIELFPPHSFLRDYEAVAQVLGHGYMAIRNDTAYTIEECIALGCEQAAGAMHDGTQIALDVSVVKRVLDAMLDAP